MTGSCAEFYFPPLRKILQQYILQTSGREVDLAEESSARFKAVQENTHVVVKYFDLRTQCYHEKVLKPVFGVCDYWYHYEFAKSRGQIPWHQPAGEMTDSHISCYMRLVKIIAVMWNSQRGLAIGLITLWP